MYLHPNVLLENQLVKPISEFPLFPGLRVEDGGWPVLHYHINGNQENKENPTLLRVNNPVGSNSRTGLHQTELNMRNYLTQKSIAVLFKKFNHFFQVRFKKGEGLN